MKSLRFILLAAALTALAAEPRPGALPAARQVTVAIARHGADVKKTTLTKSVAPKPFLAKQPPALPVAAGQRHGLAAIGGSAIAPARNTAAVSGTKLERRKP